MLPPDDEPPAVVLDVVDDELLLEPQPATSASAESTANTVSKLRMRMYGFPQWVGCGPAAICGRRRPWGPAACLSKGMHDEVIDVARFTLIGR